MDFIFIKSSKAGKEDFGSVYARVRTGKANVKTVTGFTIRQLEWEKYRSLQYTSSALMSSIGIKYGQFAQVLARIKAAFEADDFDPKKAKPIIESVKHDVLNGMMHSYLTGFIYSALIDSFCSEQQARMTAMDSANRNAEELLADLSLQYNRVRQAAITQEITEVTAGAKAQRKKRRKKEVQVS